MQIAKWGNSLAVRLPAALVKHLTSRRGKRSNFMPSAREASRSIGERMPQT